MSLDELHAARDTIRDSIRRYQALQHLQQRDPNFQSKTVKGSTDLPLAECEASIHLAECSRMIAVLNNNPIQRNMILRESMTTLHDTLELALSLPAHPTLEFKVLKQMGKLYHAGKNFSAAKDFYTRALRGFRDQKDVRGTSDAKVCIRGLAIEQDRIGALVEKMRSLASKGNKEEEQVRQIFNKHDKDGNGFISTDELQSLAKEFGTFPPLTPAELDEALDQIDQSDDDQISFDELWAWWISDRLQ